MAPPPSVGKGFLQYFQTFSWVEINPPTPWGQSVVDQCFYTCRMAGGGQIAPGTKKTPTAGASSPPLLRMFRAIFGCWKNCSFRKRLFCTISRFLDLSDADSKPFWVPKRVPGDDFLVIFERKSVFSNLQFFFRDFAFFLKKRRKTCSKIETTFFPQKSPKSRPRGPVLGPKMLPD